MEIESTSFSDLRKLFEDIAIRFQETDRQFKETDRQLKESKLETDRQLKESKLELDKQMAETDRQLKESKLELDRQMAETDRQIKKLSKELGHLGNRFGEFNEALVLPSLNRLFEEKFNCKQLSQRYRVLMNGNSIEIDLLAISADSIYLIEIKSKHRKDDLKQLMNHIEKFKENAPEYQNKKIYGVIVATDYNKDNIKELERKGIYFISIADDLVKLHHSPNFEPFAW